MRTKQLFLLAVLAFFILLFLVPGKFIPSELGNTILTISTFLFGLIAGFYIVVTTTDYNSIKSILAEETAGWIALYTHVSLYDAAAARKLSGLIDRYIRRAFDFEIIQYAQETEDDFTRSADFVRSLRLKKDKEVVHERILESMEKIITMRQQLTVLGTRTLSVFQWLILFALGAMVIVSLYGLRSGELFFEIVTVLISGSIVLILLLIRDLDLYIWNETTFGYTIFQNVLKATGQLPYYPIESLKKKRVTPMEARYRVGLNDGDSKSSERKIEIRTNK